MRYIVGLIIFVTFCHVTFKNYKKIAKETTREVLKEVRKKGYSSYKAYIADAEKKEAAAIRKKRTRKRWKKYHKNHKAQ